MLKIACFGCGVDSVAGILHYGIDSYDEIIFADTGSEKPETYDYLEYLINDKKWPITVVKGKLGVLYDYYFKKKIYPTPFFRDCTKKFKIQPIRNYLRKKYGKKEFFEMSIFIDHSEFHRAKGGSDVQYQKLVYPLVYDKITREECIKIITDSNYLVPLKSGCFMCPFTNKKRWAELKVKHPDLFKKALELEQSYKPKVKIRKLHPLISLKAKETPTLYECGCF